MTLGERVEALMREQGISQAELARRVGLTQPAIFALIRRNKSGSKSLHRVAQALGTTAAYLNRETDDRSIDGSRPPLSSAEQELLDLSRGLAPKDMAAILQLLRTIATSAAAPGLNDNRQEFRGE